MTLQLSTEGFWRTRDGRKARIYALDGSGWFPVHGAYLANCGIWDMFSTRQNGRYHANELIDCGMDIVGHWPEEKQVEAWVWLLHSGSLYTTDCPPPPPCPNVLGAVRLTGTVTEGRFE